MARKIFMVKGPGPSTATHCDFQSAKTEADRLARVNPGVEFHVVGSICVSTRREVDTEWFDGEQIEMPL